MASIRSLFLPLAVMCVLPAFAAAQPTTAEGFFDRASVKALESYGKNGGPAVADAAIADYDAAIALKPDYHEAYNGRANMRLSKEDLDGALSDYSKAVELSPKTPAYWSNRAKVREKKKDVAGALADCDKALELNPKNHHTWLDRGEIKLRSKDYEGALIDFDKALEVKPDYFAVRKRRAAVYRAWGKNALADAEEKIYKDESAKFMEKLLGR